MSKIDFFGHTTLNNIRGLAKSSFFVRQTSNQLSVYWRDELQILLFDSLCFF